MVIPNKFKLGRKTYTVKSVRRVSPAHTGRVYPEAGLIKIGDDSPDKPLTFWHEVTHAILHDMGDARWADEVFVTKFSRRLSQIVRTANVNGQA